MKNSAYILNSLSPSKNEYLYQSPEIILLSAVRAWAHPYCEFIRSKTDWRPILTEQGINQLGLKRFHSWMSTLKEVMHRPLFTHCRCIRPLANDEKILLKAMALLQRGYFYETINLFSLNLNTKSDDRAVYKCWTVAETFIDHGLVIPLLENNSIHLH